ncbi:DUF4262 domain-containing protein [Amycolatopsis sp. CA-161197]|uniref:DUF4262 domain-containing protein n=1 Tax=Amycolatopsis sp. CA-161197 TaxID=3239922 RepID=UPI003D8B1F85
MRATLDEHMWAIQFAAGSGSRPPLAYTVGMTAHGMSELVAVGLSPTSADALLHHVAERSVRDDPPRHGDVCTLAGLLGVEFVSLTDSSAHLHVATMLYGTAVRALQVVYSDEAGRFPWTSSFRDGRGGQPVLGVRHPRKPD